MAGRRTSTKVGSCFVRLPTQADQYDLSVMTELDIWRSANILLKRYGAEAVFIATKRADALLDQGDVQGASAWVRIAKAITDLERRTPNVGEKVH
jgi:hypothetical protein